MKSLKINYLDGSDLVFNNKMVTNYENMLEWLNNNDDLPCIVYKSDGTSMILYKHAIKNVFIFKTT